MLLSSAGSGPFSENMRIRFRFISLILITAMALPVHAQRELPDITSHYYRVDPFKSDFSTFIQTLISDPGLTEKQVVKRSDTSFFYFKGTYKSFNPFSFLPIRTEVILAEQVQQLSDSLPELDTFLVYQIIGYTSAKDAGATEVNKEYIRFNRQYRSVFDVKNNADLGSNGAVNGQVTNYFFAVSYLSPMTVAWGRHPASREYIFAISLRLKIMDNRSVLAGIPYQTQ